MRACVYCSGHNGFSFLQRIVRIPAYVIIGLRIFKSGFDIHSNFYIFHETALNLQV